MGEATRPAPPGPPGRLPIDFEGELPDFVQDEADEEPANNDDDDDHHEQEDEEYVLPDINNANRWILGHRGNSWDYPQNTLQAFQSCVDLGCDCNEMDLRRTKDGVLVVFHDASVDSVTNGKGKVNTYTFAELQKLDAGYRFTRDGGKTYPFRGKGYKIPSLAQVFSKIKKGYFNMDMKDDDSRVPQELYNLIRSHGVANRSIVGSFIDRNTEAFRKIAPSIQSLATAKEATAFAAAFHKGDNAAACRAVSASNWQDLPTHLTKNWPAYIKLSHQCKNKVAFWTINDTATMEKLLKDGADGIITDKVAEAARLFRRLGYKK
ncbi:hypothetical protein H696_05596 [Fonticula alba]|uniref:GP-PDE domain-containing protein n=1 Tax=Fonticula alba TaxID=691883 RepID=A0A058Z150_FONAL|nr:hypothetical protein H696_05596 [Fonticula alba]KCV67866.1 hypothetical protein H696_05596 [Fonticula alba]|eukprot:XP_009497686.1 hypothetical protein H696_05596 [Fonticula alba]